MTAFHLKTLRLNKGLSLDALGKLIDVSGVTIWQVENGKVTPNPATAFKIASYWGLEVLDLWPELAESKKDREAA